MLEVEVASATAEGKAKRAEKLSSMVGELQAKSGAVRELKPLVRKQKYEAEVKAVKAKLASLAKIENSKVRC